ncbi:3400_t:CDS:2, partial [Funneliformis caledonium]
MDSMNREDWLLWQFADSALPTGGFVASSGLEVAIQTGYVKDSDSLSLFLSSSIENYAYSALPFVTDSWQVLFETSNEDVILESIIKLDHLYEACTSNVITKRASKAQGVAMLTLFSKSFGEEFGNEGRKVGDKVVDRLKFEVRKENTFGHLPITFGLVSKCLGISLERAQQLFLFLFSRAALSAAVRLNIVGPYYSQRMLTKCQTFVDTSLKKTYNIKADDAAQTSPILDILQETDTKTLYSCLFVNRTWCMNIIPFIWKKPFKISKNIEKLVPIFFSFLNDETKEFLQVQNQNLDIPYTLLFDYPCYIKEMHFGSINYSIEKWIDENRIIRPTLCDDYFTKNESSYNYNFIRFVSKVNKSERIEILKLCEHGNEYQYNSIKILFYQSLLFSTPKIENRLKNLQKLICMENWFREEIFIKLSNISNNIKYIHVDIDVYNPTLKDKESFTKLIKSQNNLEKIIISCYNTQNYIDEFMKALINHTHSLKSINLEFGKIKENNSLSFLKNCFKLEELILNRLELAYDYVELLFEIILPNLKKLYIHN